MTEQPADYTEMAQERAGGLRLIRRTLIVLLVMVTLNVGFTAWQFSRISQESVERQDQVCRTAEREDAAEIEGLRRTYDYLSSLTAKQRREPLNRLLLRMLPDTERRARTVVAPKFCDEPGVGLREPQAGDPDAVVPERPPGLTP